MVTYTADTYTSSTLILFLFDSGVTFTCEKVSSHQYTITVSRDAAELVETFFRSRPNHNAMRRG